MTMDKMNKGIYLAFATAFVSGVAVFMNKFAVGFWESSSVFTTAKNLMAVLFLMSALLLLKKLPELKKISGIKWVKLIAVGLIGGSIPFLLFFKGLTMAEATSAAFIHKTLFIWVALLAVPFLKEKLSWLQFASLGFLFSGVYLFVSPQGITVGTGEMLILGATLFWAAENIVSKRLLKDTSALVLAWARMFFGSAFLLVFLALSGGISELATFSFNGLGWLLLTGLFLFGYVTTWYSALKYAPATVVSSVLVLAAPITAILNSIFITGKFNTGLIIPIGLMVLGCLILSKLYERITIFHKIRTTT
jgi:drug/metabolite transporter (DMT)-like permease